ncbi:23S rRNA (uracil(1939)-C(5))-methyltransferase RlmD [Lachnospiraceae bacterium JLR.KK008]
MVYKKNDIILLHIEDLSAEGQGIGKAEGFPFFVKDAVIGDTIEARVTKLKKNYGYARLEKVVTPSSFRVEPMCAFHKQCGGCQIQVLSYERQLEFKTKKVANNLIRLGGFPAELIERKIEPIIGMQTPFHYRNKAQFPIGTDKNNDIVVGFYAGRTHTIIANTDCALGTLENREILEAVLSYMRNYKVEAYDEGSGRGLIRHVLIRKGFATGELMVCLIINGQSLPFAEELTTDLIRIKGMTSVSYCVNREKTNVIMGEKVVSLWGSRTIRDQIGEITFSISPLSFYQINPVQTRKLYELAVEYADLHGTETVWDLYCGIGTISIFMAGKAGRVYGVEVIPQAIEDARENARLNGIDNAEFIVGKAENVLPEKYASEGIHADVIVVDPPRKGCDEKCLETILQMRPQKIVYVSCDSATLARDLKILCEGGYELQRVRPVDMFPQTVHVETVVMLSHKNPTA